MNSMDNSSEKGLRVRKLQKSLETDLTLELPTSVTDVGGFSEDEWQPWQPRDDTAPVTDVRDKSGNPPLHDFPKI